MSPRDEQKLLAFEEELAQLIDRHTPAVSEANIAFALEVLAEHMRERAQDCEERTRADTPLVHESSAMLEPDSVAEEEYAPSSEAHCDPPTVQIAEEALEVSDAEAAILTPASAARSRERAGPFAAQPPPLPAQTSAPRRDRSGETGANPASAKPSQDAAQTPFMRQCFARAREAYNRKTSAAKKGAVAKFRGTLLTRRLSLSNSLNCLGLKLYERPLLDRVLAQTRPFDEVVGRSPLPMDSTAAVLIGLDAIDLLDIRPAASGAARPTPRALVQTPGGVLSHLDALDARLRREHDFDLLGVHWTAHRALIVGRLSEFDELLAGLGQGEVLAAGVRQRIGALRARLKERGEYLCDDSRRRDYRRELIDASTRRETARKLSMLADAAFKRKTFEHALDYYLCLLELDPDHPRARRLVPVLKKRLEVSTTGDS